jgi:hypothetical protein
MTDFAALLSTLGKHKVDFIVVGGAAAIAHGSARLTQDLGIYSVRKLRRGARKISKRSPSWKPSAKSAAVSPDPSP